MTRERAFVRHAACRLAVVVLISLSVTGVVSWQSAGSGRASAAVAPSASSESGLPQPIGFWRLGPGPKGAAAASVADGGSGKHSLAGQNVIWCPVSTCAAFNGSDAAFTTSGPVVNTGPGSSFTVSAQVKLKTLPAGGQSATAVGQDGGSHGNSSFYLQWNGTKKCWAFARETDQTFGCDGKYTGVWARLTGVYNGSSGKAALYVNGKLAGTTADSAPAASNGPVTIGRAMFQGKQADWWPGSIRNVELFGQALSPAQVHAIAALVASGSSATAPAPSAAPSPAASAAPSPTASAPSPAASAATASRASSPAPSASGSRGGTSATVWIAIGIAVLVIAALIGAFALYRRRGKPAARGAARSAAPAPADRSGIWAIDRALRALTTACDDQGIAFPGAYLVTVDAESIAVTVSRPSTRSPAGWAASSDGRTWSARLSELQTSSVRDTGGNSFAGLAMLGASEDGQVLLDLAQAGGPISVDGPKAAVDEVVEAWIRELTASPWSAPVRVARVYARTEPDLESAENLLADLHAGERALIVFEEPPSRSQTAALRDRFTADVPAWILIKGAAPAATWRLTANRGLLSSGFLPDITYSAPSGAPRPGRVSPAGR